MNTFTRILLSGPGAFIITTGLALVMAKMIYVPFVALPDKPDKMSFTINPDIIDVIITPKDKPPVEFKKITPPPAPPIIERPTPSLPTVPISDLDGAIPDIKRLRLDPTTVNLVISDKAAQPLVRFEPVMPLRAEKSGHCSVRLSVSAQGLPYDIVTTECSQSIFRRPTIKAVQTWQYNPKISNGQAVSMGGVETLISFKLTDEHGRIIPE